MRLIHTADVHIGRRLTASRFPNAAAKRRAAPLDALRRLVEYANRKRVDYILCAGDLIDQDDVRVADLKSLADVLSQLEHAQAILVAGNHDPLDARSVYARVDWPNCVRLMPPGYSRILLDARTALHAYSFAQTIQRENPLKHLALDMSAPRNLLLMHGDALASASDYLPLSEAFLRPFDYCALGHVHQPQSVAPNARYCGSLEPLDRNETGAHGFVLLDCDEDIRAQFIPFARAQYEKMDVMLNENMSDAHIEQTIRALLAAQPAHFLCSVTLSGPRAYDSALDIAALQQRLSDENHPVYLIDRTHPYYDAEALALEHAGDVLGRFLASFDESNLSEELRLARDYGVRALLEGGRAK